MMKTLTIKGVSVPALGLGTWSLNGRDCERAVATAIEAGYRHIDTARAYGNEAEVGAGLRASGIDRGDIFLTTKIWYDDLAAGRFQRATEQSIGTIGVDYADLVLVHWPNADIPLGETLEALAEVKARGLARNVGVSNFPVALMREAIEKHGADLLCNQVEYHPFLKQDAVIAYARSQGLMITAYCPIARGQVMGNATLAEIGRRRGKSEAQVTLRWLVQQDGIAVIPKAGSEKHIRANMEIFDFTLSPEDMAAISALGGDRRLVDPAWAPDWDAA